MTAALWRAEAPQPLLHPGGLVREAVFFMEGQQLPIAPHEVELRAGVQLPQADGACMHGTRIGFAKMIGPAHDALKPGAVRDAKHVPGLVDKYMAAATQHETARFIAPRLSIELG